MDSPRAVAAVILALGIAASAVILCIETIIHAGPVSSEEATVLSTVLGASVGAVATYLGGGHHEAPSGEGPPAGSPDTPPGSLSPAPESPTTVAGGADTTRPPAAG